MAEERQQTLEEIEQTIASLRQQMASIAEIAAAQAYRISAYGLTIGEKGHQLFTGGAGDWEAPTIHPVWERELTHEVDMLRSMGEATCMYEHVERERDEWAAARQEQQTRRHEHGMEL